MVRKVEKVWCIYSMVENEGLSSLRLEGTAKNWLSAEFRKLKIWFSNRERKLRIQRDTVYIIDLGMELR